MKTNFKLSSKMHILIIVSTVLIAIGLAVGLICEFVADGFFNYGADWASYKSITVSYNRIDGEEVVRPGSPEFFGLDLDKTKELGLYIPSVKDSQKTDVKKACRRGKKPA